MRFAIRVIPRASKNAVEPPRDGRVVVRVTAPPVDSAANEAVIELLAKAHHVPKRQVRIVSGHNSRNKMVEIVGLAAD